TVKCWGNNDAGQLGDGTTGGQHDLPVSVRDLSEARGLALSSSHSCALLSDGTVECWGGNELGQLGDGSMTQSSTPVRVTGLSGVVEIVATKGAATGRGLYTASSSYSSSTCARLFDGTVRCWGDNKYHLVGSLCASDVCPTPVKVEGLSGAT